MPRLESRIMKAFELKVPPVVVLLIALIGVYIGAKFDVTPNVFGAAKNTIAWSLFGIGVLIGVIGVITFKRAGTSVHPVNLERTSALVTHGIYRYTRNPMYLGMVFILLSLIVCMHSPIGLISLVGFIGYMTRFQIQPEERMLAGIFPETFTLYMQQVRRWI